MSICTCSWNKRRHRAKWNANTFEQDLNSGLQVLFITKITSICVYICEYECIYACIRICVCLWMCAYIYSNLLYKGCSLRPIGIMIRVFASGPRGSILGRVIPKTQKMVLDASLLHTQQCKVRFKGTWSKPGKEVVPCPTHWCSSFWKRSHPVAFNYGVRYIYDNHIFIFILYVSLTHTYIHTYI